MRDYYYSQILNPDLELEAELLALGLHDYEYKDLGPLGPIIRLKLPADDFRLPVLLELVQTYSSLDAYYTEFSHDDYADAIWLEADIISWIGYPRPLDSWNEVTYDLDHPDYCSKCRTGFVQNNPFRFPKSHKRGKTISFCNPGWVPDALFVRAAVKRELIAQSIKGIDYLQAIEAGSKKPFEDVIQAIVGHVLEPALLNFEDFPCETCAQCGRRKWLPWRRVNRFKRAAFDDQLDMVLTHEWFGTGGLAFRKILVSRRFAELVQEQRWRGLRLKPIILE